MRFVGAMKSLSAVFYALTPALVMLCALPSEAATEKVLYSFCSQLRCADGANPLAAVLRVKGELYVTASAGGGEATGQGTVVAIDRKTGAATAVYSFVNYSGNISDSVAALIHVNGRLYGTSARGGAGEFGNGAGTVFSLNPKSGALNILYSFCIQQNCADGGGPRASLLNAGDLFYGTTQYGGNHSFCGNDDGCGSVFSLDPATGKEKVLYAFCASQFCPDGSQPFGALVDVNGILYGTTFEGGNGSGCSDMN